MYYPIEDDLIGGYGVATVDKPMSEQDSADVLCCLVMTYEKAQEIADAMNRQGSQTNVDPT